MDWARRKQTSQQSQMKVKNSLVVVQQVVQLYIDQQVDQ